MRSVVFRGTLFIALPLSAATYEWTADGDGASIYQEANWTLNGDGSTSIPQINPTTAVNHDLVVNSGTPGGGGGGNGTLDLGSGSLTLNAGTFRMSLGNGAGIINGPIIQNGGRIIAQFTSNSSITLTAGSLELGGTGNPINNTTINFPTGSTAVILSSETPPNFLSEHLSKITVNGAPAVNGQNFAVVDNGNGNTIARIPLPAGDSDNDGLEDPWEIIHFGDLTSSDGSGDADGDTLTDRQEFTGGTDPNDRDTDGDLLSDSEEGPRYGTNPILSDTDGDSNPDGFEIAKGTDPLDASSKTDRPNIIFILADDLGYGDLGVLFQNTKSGKKHKTPFFDQMAADGMILNRHYCPAPVCAPSRASLMSGLHQGHANIRDNQFDKELEDNHNLATTLKQAGYATAHIGKHGLQGSGSSPGTWPAYPTKRGFDSFYGYVRHGDGHTHYPDHVTDSRGKKQVWDQNTEVADDLDNCFTPDLFTARAKKLIIDEVNDGDQEPFFLYLAYDTPHAALQLPTIAYPGWNPSDDTDDSGFGVSGGVQWLGTPGKMINTATGTIDSYRHPDYTSAVGNSWTDVEERQAGLIRRMDDNIGDLRKTLEDLGIANNTLIVFSSDNGPHSEDYLTNAQTNDGSSYLPTSFDSYGPFEGQKRDCWEGGLREPSLVVWPGTVPAGSLTNQHSQFHDWLPTFCEAAGITAPARTDGVSLMPTLTQSGTQEIPTTYVEYSTNGSTPNWADFNNHGKTTRSQAQVIFLDGYKGIRNNPANADGDFDIYDTVTDLDEATNLRNTTAYFTELNERMKDRVLQIRQPLGSASRPWDSANVPPPTSLPSLANGVNFSTFTGLWSWVPEFSDLTPTTSGSGSNVDLTNLPASSQSRGYLMTGYLLIPTSGTWNFSLTSDSGSFLRIHEIMVTDDDYHHDGSTTSGSVQLAAGYHPYRLYYKNDQGVVPTLALEWSGPGVARQAIPDSSLFIEGTPDPIPTAKDDTASTTNGSTITIDALANDLDDGLPAALTLSSVGSPRFGSASVVGNQIQYTPATDTYATDSLTYTITDGENSASATITVTHTFQAADLWLPLDECTGPDLREASGYFAGTASGFANLEASRIEGARGKGISFDGKDDQFTLSGLPTLPSGSAPRTVMCWVRTTAGAASENQTMFSYGQNSNGQRFSFRLNGSGGNSTAQPLRLEVQGGSIVGTTTLADGDWHHVAVVCDDFNNNGSLQVEETRLYVNGSLENISSSAARVINTAPGSTAILGGSNHSPNYNFAGDIDDFRLYPSALSAADILSVINQSNTHSLAWHRQHFGDAAINWLGDDDLDGSPRLLEYAIGSEPWTHAPVSLSPIFNPSTNKLEITYNQLDASLSNLIYTVEASSNLQDWETLTTSIVNSTTHPSLDCFDQVTFETDTSRNIQSTQFLRLKVETTP
ncbi:MAG: sulfatase-like hydrolase/transferase [Akkermansiaceae bacterium]